MAKMYWEKDAKPQALQGKTVAVLGYGSQGRAHALNLRDSGVDTVLGLRAGGKSWEQARADGWSPLSPAEAVKQSDLVAVLVPDMAQTALYKEAVEPNLKPGMSVLFAHGFNVHYGNIRPPATVNVLLLAPKSPGQLVRRQYELGQGVPGLIGVYQSATPDAFDQALAYAHGVGCTRAGVLETSFKEETETDLFGEQAVLCGGVSDLITAGFETLVNAGYQPELAYFECLHELKLIVDLIYEGGFAKLLTFISETAQYGDFTRGPRIIDSHVRETMKQVLKEIQDGSFAREWMAEDKAGRPEYRRRRQAELDHSIEKVGKALREKMSWIEKTAQKSASQTTPKAANVHAKSESRQSDSTGVGQM